MQNLGKLTVWVILFIIGLLVSLLNVHVILSISKLYNLSFITQFTFVQIYGALLIILLISFKIEDRKKKVKEQDFIESLKDSSYALLGRIVAILFSWGMAFIMYKIIS